MSKIEVSQTRPVLNRSTFTEENIAARENDLVRLRDEETDPRYGSRPSDRPIDTYLNYGFIVLDKPQGPTSHQVAAWIRNMFKQQRAGYSGTLDPPVSGVLPIGLGDATKALTALLLGPKEYVAVARIHDSVPDSILLPAIAQFKGPVFQKPPQRSSVKRATRTREIYELEILEREGNLILLRVLCEAGTYIRKLIYDIGEIIKVGATMAELRRTRVCQLGENDLVRLQNLYEAKAVYEEQKNEAPLRAVVKPIESAVSFLRQIRIRDSAVESICQGAQLAIPGILAFSKGISKGEIVRIVSAKGELVAIAEAQMEENEIVSLDHGIAAITRRVIMRQGTYPKMWKSKDETQPVSEAVRKSILDSLEAEDMGERQEETP